MNVLLKNKKQLETHFGKTSTMASNLLGMVAEGEKAISFRTGAMDAGFEVTIGLFNDKARYAAFKKRSGKKWEESDLRAILSQIGSFSNWTSKPGSEFIDYVEKENNKVVAEATGWFTPKRKYAFVYVPTLPNEVGLTPDRSSIDPRF